MAWKSKRMALNEAIRQGQAKMAEGLKTGQIESDSPPVQEDKRDLSRPKNIAKFSAKCVAVFLKSKEQFANSELFSPKMRLIVLSCVALVLGIWLVFLLGTDQSLRESNSEPQRIPVADISPEASEQGEKQVKKKFSLFGLGGRDSSDSVGSVSSEKESLLSPPNRSVNVIWIQSIAMNRKGELDSLGDFFRSKGIQTEIIEVPDSNYAVLVTQDGFEKNPGAKGTEGYKLLERIKQLGLVYVEETDDTKFGLKPFQDALGYKR